MLDVREKGRVARVCTKWRDAADLKSVWKGTEARLHLRKHNQYLFPSLQRRGIRKVQVLSLRRSLKDVMGGIPNLTSLNLSGCYNVTDIGVKQAFQSSAPSLQRLDLALCKQITDKAIESIGQYAPGLQELELGGCCNISNQGLRRISQGLQSLRRLGLRSCCHISDDGIAYLCGAAETGLGSPELRHLCLQDCQKLSDESLLYISQGLRHLQCINLSFCASITDSGLKHLATMTNLKEINLRSCDNVSDTGIAFLAEGNSRLTSLDVSFCDKIGDNALAHIAQGLYTLTSLSCSACNISDTGIERIAKSLHQLDTLHIGQCVQVTDRGLTLISLHLTSLDSIDLFGCNRITTVGLERIMRLPHLSELNLGLWHNKRKRSNW